MLLALLALLPEHLAALLTIPGRLRSAAANRAAQSQMAVAWKTLRKLTMMSSMQRQQR